MRSFRFAPLVAILFGLISSRDVAGRGAEWKLEESSGGLKVFHDGEFVTEYLTKSGAKPILWPIHGPGGVEMTRAYPMKTVEGEKQDHIHQRSFWFTHGNVNGVDFWSEQGDHGVIEHREFLTREASDQKAIIATRNDWLDAKGKKQLEDERRLTFRQLDGSLAIDFDVTVKATAGAATFGDTKEGAFGLRVPTFMDVNSKMGGRIVNREGLTDAAAWGKPAAWVDYHAPSGKTKVGVAILNHPTSFRYPTRWHVREYGLFAANPFGLHDFEGGPEGAGAHVIPEGETMTLRYRVIFHAGDEKEAKIAEAFERYAAEK